MTVLDDMMDEYCTQEVELVGGPLDGEIFYLEPGLFEIEVPAKGGSVRYVESGRFDNTFIYIEKGK